MQSDSDLVFQPDVSSSPTMKVELISANARIAGAVHLNRYTRLSDLVNFQGEVITVFDPVIVNPRGLPVPAELPSLDIRLDELTLVIDRSNAAPSSDSLEAIAKTPHGMMALTHAHLIFGTFFTYPSGEPVAYLRAEDPHWIPIADMKGRSLIDPRIEFEAPFAVVNRRHIVSTTIL